MNCWMNGMNEKNLSEGHEMRKNCKYRLKYKNLLKYIWGLLKIFYSFIFGFDLSVGSNAVLQCTSACKVM